MELEVTICDRKGDVVRLFVVIAAITVNEIPGASNHVLRSQRVHRAIKRTRGLKDSGDGLRVTL